MCVYLISSSTSVCLSFVLSLLHTKRCSWVSLDGSEFSCQQLKGQLESSLYMFLKFAFIVLVVLERRFDNIETSSLVNRGLLRYGCISSLAYIISFTFEWDCWALFNSVKTNLKDHLKKGYPKSKSLCFWYAKSNGKLPSDHNVQRGHTYYLCI